MATIKLKNSQVKGKVPGAGDLDVGGELAVNHHADDPGLFLKDTAGNIRKIAGTGSISTPNASTTVHGLVQLADAAAITAGTAGRVVDAAQLKAVSDADDWTRTGTTLAPKAAGDVVSISAGTAALPGLTPVGDPNTGLYSHGPDQVAISTGGTGRLFVGSTGNTEIISTSSLPLQVSAFLPRIRSKDSTGTNTYADFYANSGTAFVDSRNDAANGTITFRGLGGGVASEYMRITPDGNVGIGTSAPATTLDVNGSVTVSSLAGTGTGTVGVDATGKLTRAAGTDKWTRTGTTLAPHTAGDVVTVSAGTAALPGLTPVGDPDTGLYSPGADQVAISTGGVEKVHIDSSGTVTFSSFGSVPITLVTGTQSTDVTHDRIQFNANTAAYYVANQSLVGVRLDNGAQSWAAQSDERLKTELNLFSDALAKVSTFRAGTGRFLTDDKNVSRSFLIAQDVQKVLPEAVSVDDDEMGTLSLRYTEVIPLLVAALKEAKDKIETLETRITTLEAQP